MAHEGVTSNAPTQDSIFFLLEPGYSNSSVTGSTHPHPDPPVALLFKILAMAVIIILAVLGNLLVIISVLLHRRIRVVANYFVVSLAMADLLVALCAMTFNASIQIIGRWEFGYVVCDMWNSFDVFFSTVSILHLCCISVDRYFAILQPLDYRKRMNKKIIAAMLAVCWTAPIGISFVPIFTGIYSTSDHLSYRAQHPNTCQFIVNKVYMVVSSCVSFWIPGIIMICTYSKIYQAAKKQHRAISRTSSSLNFYANDCVVHLDSITEEQLAVAMSALKNNPDKGEESFSTAEPTKKQAGRSKDETNGSASARTASPVAASCADRSQGSSFPPPPVNMLGKKTSTVSFYSADSNNEHQSRSAHAWRLLRMRINGSNMLREHKAAKTLGVIMGCFLLCWLPFFTWYATATLCDESCNIPPVLVDVLFWIGYFNSILNPMIYAYFNREFRDAYRETLAVLACRRRSRHGISGRGGKRLSLAQMDQSERAT